MLVKWALVYSSSVFAADRESQIIHVFSQSFHFGKIVFLHLRVLGGQSIPRAAARLKTEP